MKTLILTEKPSVGMEFVKSLSRFSHNNKKEDGYFELDKYIITWAIGHLLKPFDPEDYDPKFKVWNFSDLPIIPKKFLYAPIDSTKKQYWIIKKIFQRSDIEKIIIATDAGREGELIARLILDETKNKQPMFRFWTSKALTNEVILDELNKIKPLSEYDRLALAGKYRQRADWLIGMNFSRAASIKLNSLFSIGRVQTAVLNLLVDKKKNIDSFIASDFFELDIFYKSKNELGNAKWFLDKNHNSKDKNLLLAIKNEIELSDRMGVVLDVDLKKKETVPDGLYSLTELQRQANIQFGFSANETLTYAQELYEVDKVLSYPRTDAKVMSETSFALVSEIVKELKEYCPEHFLYYDEKKLNIKNKIVFDDTRLTDHHGLIPLRPYLGSSSSQKGKIYQLVLKKFISNFLSNFIYSETKIILGFKNHTFSAIGVSIQSLGFMHLMNQEKKENMIPNLKKNDIVMCDRLEILSKKTKPPFHYTEASLLYDMTNPARLVDEAKLKNIFKTEVGLGTQATRAQVIETLLARGYVEREKKNLKATSKGELLIQTLEIMPTTSQFTSIKQTASMELYLSEIASGKLACDSYLREFENLLPSIIKEWENFKTPGELGACPLCSGRVIENQKSFGCSNWKNGCKMVIWKEIAGVKLSKDIAIQILNNKKSELIKNLNSKTGKKFDAFLILNNEGKIVFDFPRY